MTTGPPPGQGSVVRCSDISACSLEVEKDTWLIADDHGIVSWRGNCNIARAEFVYSAIVHYGAEMPRNDVGEMSSLATLCAGDGPHMLGPPPARLTGHSDDRHVPKFDDFHTGLWGCPRLVWRIEALHL